MNILIWYKCRANVKICTWEVLAHRTRSHWHCLIIFPDMYLQIFTSLSSVAVLQCVVGTHLQIILEVIVVLLQLCFGEELVQARSPERHGHEWPPDLPTNGPALSLRRDPHTGDGCLSPSHVLTGEQGANSASGGT